MSGLEIFATQSLDERAVLDYASHIHVEFVQNFIGFALFELHLGLDVVLIVRLDLLDDGLGILFQKDGIVPLSGQVLELLSVVPQIESLLVSLLENIHFRDFNTILDVEHILVLLVLLHFLLQAVVLALDFVEFLESELRFDIRFGQNLTVESVNLISDLGLLLLNFLLELSQIALTGHGSLVVSLGELVLQLLDNVGDLLNLDLQLLHVSLRSRKRASVFILDTVLLEKHFHLLEAAFLTFALPDCFISLFEAADEANI